MINKLKFVFAGNTRDSKYQRNTLIIIMCQAGSIISSLLLVPLTLDYLGVKEYGVWMTLTTIISWFVFFDIGLGHGLRNKYAEAKARENFSDVKKYVSTAFFSLSFISLMIFLIFSVFSFLANWSMILNAPENLAHDLKILALFVGGFFCLRFIVNIVTILLTADQEPSLSNIIGLLGQVLSLGMVFLITKITDPSILYIGIALSASQLFPLIVAFVFFFLTRYRAITPSLKYFSKSHIRSIFSLGSRFFLIQMTALILFQSNNIIIAHVCGPENVTRYNVAFKYLNVIYFLFTAFLTPLWSATTEAFTKGEFAWIKERLKQLNKLWLMISAVGIVMVLFAPFVYKLWLKGTLTADFGLLSLLWIYFFLLMRSQMFRYFMNGVGKIYLQFYVTSVQSLIHIPLAIYLGRLFGLKGILFVLIAWAFTNAIWEQIQYTRIINNTAKGVWNK
jgi:O-antigen/teichoic acid export membrane protein